MKSIKWFFRISVFFLSISLLSGYCYGQRHQRVQGNGNIQSQSRQAGDFTRIDCSGSFHLYLTQGNTSAIKVEADENLLPYIITDVSGDKLSLKTKKGLSIHPSKPVNIYLDMKKFEALSVSGAGNAQSRNTLQADHIKLAVSGSADMNLDIKTNTLKTAVSGSSKMELRGSAASAEYHISGSADMKAYGLVTDNTDVHISGMGKLNVFAQKKLDVSISGMGNVKYKGSPEISQSVSGMGKITKE